MGREAIVERILSDAHEEAERLLKAAKEEADGILSDAASAREERLKETDGEIAERAERIREGRAAAARLDSQKILLLEKRRVIDEIYARALKELLALPEREALLLTERLLRENAEEGDEVRFAADFPYAEKAAALAVFKEKKLTLSNERALAGGGFRLCGKKCDRDVSYAALLALDREEHQSALARKLFNSK